MSNYARIIARLTNTPLLITPEYMNMLLTFMNTRTDDKLLLPDFENELDEGLLLPSMKYDARYAQGERNIVDGVATIPVEGSLAYKSGKMQGMSSRMQSYQEIAQSIQAADADPEVRGILMRIDSGGGEATGNFSLIRSMQARRGNKPLWAMVDEFAASAAFNIAAAADRVVGSPEMQVGSVGVMVAHMSRQAQLEQEGVKVTFIHAGKHKVEGNPAEDLSEEALARIQSGVDATYDTFVSLVAQNRGISEGDVRATEADVLRSDEALAAGFVDEIVSTDEGFGMFAEHCSGASHFITANSGDTRMSGESQGAAVGATPDTSLSDTERAALQADADARVQATQDRVLAVFALTSVNRSEATRAQATALLKTGMTVEEIDAVVTMSVPATPVADVNEPADLAGQIYDRAATGTEDVHAHLSGSDDGNPAPQSISANIVQMFKDDTGTAYFSNSRAKRKASPFAGGDR